MGRKPKLIDKKTVSQKLLTFRQIVKRVANYTPPDSVVKNTKDTKARRPNKRLKTP